MYQRHITRAAHAVVLGALCMLIAATAIAQTAPDNTKVNTRDRAKGAVTAGQQKNNVTDLDLARKIRRSLVKDKSLSTYAHNVKVVAQGGQVTIKGPVRSDDEKRTVEAKATEIAGAGHVANELSVAPGRVKKSPKS